MKRVALMLIILCVPLIAESRTLAELTQDFRKKTWELTGNQATLVDDTVIFAWLNDGQDAVASLLEPIELRTAFESNAGFLEVAMPINFQSVRSAFVKDVGGLIEVPPGMFGLIDTGFGTYYTHGQTFHFDGHLRTNVDDSVIVLYYGSATRMAAVGDTSEVRIDLQRLIVDYAYSNYEASRHRVESMLAIRKEIREQLQQIRAGRKALPQTE